jgi:hypothetical protein
LLFLALSPLDLAKINYRADAIHVAHVFLCCSGSPRSRSLSA